MAAAAPTTTGHLYKVKTPNDFFDCHKKDDKHKETFGQGLRRHYLPSELEEKARFDHDKTEFPGQATPTPSATPASQGLQRSAQAVHRLPQEGRQAREVLGR